MTADTTRIFLSQPDVGIEERDALMAAFESGWIAPVGPDLDQFERDLTSVVGLHAAVLSSGTAALHLALLSMGVGEGDVVFVSTFTFVATANAVRYCGARPVFIDSDAISWNMNPHLLAEALVAAAAKGRLPKAVVVVDLYGQCADYDRLCALCAEFGVPVLEDAAEALGATYRGRPAGSLGDAAVLSFNGNKIITTSGGGALLSHDPAVIERAKYLATQARQPTTHYEHTEVGYNYRMSNLLAALGRAQLKRLPSLIERRREISRRYRSALADTGLTFMPIPSWSQPNHWLTCVLFDSATARDSAMASLAGERIESRPLWKPLHLQPAFEGHDSVVDGASESLFATGLCLPSGSVLRDDDIDQICAIVVRR